MIFDYGTITLWGVSFQKLLLTINFLTLLVPTNRRDNIIALQLPASIFTYLPNLEG